MPPWIDIATGGPIRNANLNTRTLRWVESEAPLISRGGSEGTRVV